ncbi:hypothetical protein FO488_19200 [Geobacter sp. FeAm09]|nr:hypothetical protein FO488_19200 [Geobacter sp. FeAm09]
MTAPPTSIVKRKRFPCRQPTSMSIAWIATIPTRRSGRTPPEQRHGLAQRPAQRERRPQGGAGIDINGSQKTVASYEYEICFRCHSGDAALAGNYNTYPQVSRTFGSLDERERFDWGSAKSWHPVAKEFVRVGNSQGLSLKSASMTMIYCNDCHDSHGSGSHLLRLENPDTFSQGQSISNYPLCYSCHDETYLTSSATNIGKLHRAHVWGQHNPLSTNSSYRASCSACHDPHGVPYKAGLTTSSNALHLINFDLRYAGSGSSYDASTSSCLVTGTGTSGLSCHPTTTGTASFNPYPYP